MADDPKPGDLEGGLKTEPKAPPASDPKDQTQGSVNIEGLVKKKDELLAELKKSQAKLKEFEDTKKKAEQADLEKKGEYEKLLEQIRAEKAELEGTVAKMKRNAALRDAAIDYKFNPKFLKLLDDAEFDDENKLLNAEAYFTKKKEELPEAFSEDIEPAKKLTGGGTPKAFKGGSKNTAELSRSLRSMSVEDFEKDEAAITAAALDAIGVRKK